MCSTMWTGIRIVRAWSAIARVIAWRIHHVAYVELEALGVVELVDRPHQTEVALLDQVEQLHPTPRIALGDADHQPQVGLGQLALGALAALHAAQQHPLLGGVGRHPRRSAGRRCGPPRSAAPAGARPRSTTGRPGRSHAGTAAPCRWCRPRPAWSASGRADGGDGQQSLDVVVVEHDLALRARAAVSSSSTWSPTESSMTMPSSVSVTWTTCSVSGGELDVAQHVGDVFGEQLAVARAAQPPALPLRSVDPLRWRFRRQVVRFNPHQCAPPCVLPANLATTPPCRALVRR